MKRIPLAALSMASSEINLYKDFSRTNIENALTVAMSEMRHSENTFKVSDIESLRDIAIDTIYESTLMVADDVVAFSADYAEMISGGSVKYNHGEVLDSAVPKKNEISEKIHAALNDVFVGGQSVAQFVDKCVKYGDKMVNEVHCRSLDRILGKRKWARVSSGSDTCKFCLMLESRGAVYDSAKAAGAHTHGFCDCRVVCAGLSKDGKPSVNVEGYDEKASYARWVAAMKDESSRKNKPHSEKRNEDIERYKRFWEIANPVEVIARLIPDDALIRTSSSQKIMYLSNSSRYRVMIDAEGGYFRIIDSEAGKREKYCLLDGSKPSIEDDIELLTHFRIEGWE